MKRLLFVTSNSLATNPRLVKELTLASKNYECKVISFQLGSWSDPFEKSIRSSFPNVSFLTIHAGKKNLLLWLLSSFLERKAKILYPFFSRSLTISSLAHSKRSFVLLLELIREKTVYDLVIAHNLASLYPAFYFSKSTKTPFAFDIEDFHPGESINDDVENEKTRRERLMSKILPFASYVSYASPLIGEYSQALFKLPYTGKYFLINNSFDSDDFTPSVSKNFKKLRFVWFSQHISPGRGLELVVPVLYKYRNKVSLTLIGKLNAAFYNEFLCSFDEVVTYVAPMEQKKLHYALSEFDIGLAIDLSSTDFNRNICLTNKIFAYSQAGLFVLATDTAAQKQFIGNYPLIGLLMKQNFEGFEDAIIRTLSDKEEIRANQELRYELGKSLSWTNDSAKLVDAWTYIS